MKEATSTILTGGTIVDGTGTSPISGEVIIQGDRIVHVGNLARGYASGVGAGTNIIDFTGCIIAPGFIDAHSHSDLPVLENHTEKLLQGVTTEVVGNCGFSAYPLPADQQVF